MHATMVGPTDKWSKHDNLTTLITICPTTLCNFHQQSALRPQLPDTALSLLPPLAWFPIASLYRESREYDAEGNELLPRPEYMIDLEFWGHWRSQQLTLFANLYGMRPQDQLVQNGKMSDAGEPSFTNVPKSYRAGIEMGFQMGYHP